MDWLGDLVVPTYVALLSLVAWLVRSVVKLIGRLTHVEHVVDRLENKVDDLSTDLRAHMADEVDSVNRLTHLILSIKDSKPTD